MAIPLQCVGFAKSIITGFAGFYTAHRDCDKLAAILLRRFDNHGAGYGMGEDYKGQKIVKVEDAVMYCKSKIHARGTHLTTSSGVSVAVSGVSAAVGGLGGSIVPGAGTIAGAAVGAGAGFGFSKGLVYTWRGLKKTKKYLTGTLGKHREQAANVLYERVMTTPSDAEKEEYAAALETLYVLQGKKQVEFWIEGGPMGAGYDDQWIQEIIDRDTSKVTYRLRPVFE
jgi:hypothetical protein